MAAPEILKEWKIAIISVGQGYESIEEWQDYRTGTRTIYTEKDISIDIRKAKYNFDKDRKPKCFNCNIYRYMAKDCQKPKKEWDTRKCYKYKKIGYITKDYRLG